MNLKQLYILHADDDSDDCLFFKEALEELSLPTSHKSVNDGDELMQYLANETNDLPDVLFLDINMPRKDGSECLEEIKFNERLKQLTVVIFSTGADPEVVKKLYKNGAHYYIKKPSDFSKFKKIIQYTFVTLIAQKNISQPIQENFMLNL
jgi:CheY-like chemotaxis protein